MLDVIEYIKMNKHAYITNEQIGSLCFIFHIKEVISGKHEVLGLENMSVIRHNMKSPNEVEEFIEFKSFSDENENFEQHHASDLV